MALYENYMNSKTQIFEKHDFSNIEKVKTKVLFFSTDKVQLSTFCESDKNFDMTLKQVNGKWGPGLYFYESAFECEKAAISTSVDGASKLII